MLDTHLDFTDDPNEWTDTEVSFEVSQQGEQTEVRITHVGIVPAFERYDKCSSAWSFYINNSHRRLITTGQGEPNTE